MGFSSADFVKPAECRNKWGVYLGQTAAVAAAQEVVVVVMGITTVSHPQLTPPRIIMGQLALWVSSGSLSQGR